jgi:hypothetical protein
MNERLAQARAAEETANQATERHRISAAQAEEAARLAQERFRLTQSKIDRLHAAVRDVMAD